MPHFIFLEWNHMWRFSVLFSFGRPLRTHNNFAFPLHSSRWYFVYASSADVSSVPASASCNCWVIDCKTGIISALVFDPITRRRCRRTGVRLSPSVSWSFLLHHNIQPPPPKKKQINIPPESDYEWALIFPFDGAEKRRQRQAAVSFCSFVPADHESFTASVICRPRSVLWKTSTSRTKFTIDGLTSDFAPQNAAEPIRSYSAVPEEAIMQGWNWQKQLIHTSWEAKADFYTRIWVLVTPEMHASQLSYASNTSASTSRSIS